MTPRDPEGQLYDIGDTALVRCPRCSSCATLTAAPHDDVVHVDLFCGSCGHAFARDCPSDKPLRPDDWYCGVSLWLQARCNDNVLWFVNEDHLDHVEQVVAQRARSRMQQREHGWSNGIHSEQVPDWLTDPVNRGAVLRALRELRALTEL